MSKRNAILAAATRLFSRKGFKGTSMAELSKATGAAGGTIFHHFKNKEDLFLNMLENVKATILTEFDRITSGSS
jgi:TetR/AcrR family fatty acid metabolism transcriptional regulator